VAGSSFVTALAVDARASIALVDNLPAAMATSMAVVVGDISIGWGGEEEEEEEVGGLDRRRRASEIVFMIVGLRDGRLPFDSRILSPGDDDDDDDGDDDGDDDDGGVSEVLEYIRFVCKLRDGDAAAATLDDANLETVTLLPLEWNHGTFICNDEIGAIEKALVE